jgi:NTP pyrophosphatase (non-canonical NTP hydrolase)
MLELSLWDKLQACSRGLERRYPNGTNPFQMMTRLLEECGELATEVHIFENSGLKRQKHGEPDPQRMAQEIKGVLLCTLQVLHYYGVEKELAATVDATYQRLHAGGWIDA